MARKVDINLKEIESQLDIDSNFASTVSVIDVQKDVARIPKEDLKVNKNQEDKNAKLTRKQKRFRKKQQKARLKALIKARKKEQKERRKAQELTLREIEQKGKIASWFRIDNAGSIYPSASARDWNFVYRVSATMKHKINEKELQSALDDVMPRFPSFNVKLRHGFFWNYFERNFARLNIEKEMDFPCRPFNLDDSNGFLIRILYSEYKIILETFHGIADGRGSLFFLNSLIARYIERMGQEIDEYIGCANHLDIPSEEEVEDSFYVHANREKSKRPKERAAYKIKGNNLPIGMVNSVEGHMSVRNVKEIAKKYGATISIFLAAVVGYEIHKNRKNTKKPTRISVPVDLRPRYNSKTLRNFASYINVEICEENPTFEQVLEIFKKELQNIDINILQSNINANVNVSKNFFVKIMPLFIKNVVLKACFNYMGENYQTLSISNLGQVKVSNEFENYVENYCFNLGRSKYNTKSIGVISYGDTLNMCISSNLSESQTERDIFKKLAELGVNIKIHSNRRDLYGSR